LQEARDQKAKELEYAKVKAARELEIKQERGKFYSEKIEQFTNEFDIEL
jgi:hypothetical protein